MVYLVLLESWQSNALKKNGYIPLGSLPGRYRQSVESFKNYKKAFLQVNGDLYVQYQQQLKTIANGRPIVGISWSGGYWAAQKRAKGLAIENWLPIFERGALCVNLQYGDTSKEEQFLKEKGFEFITFPKVDYKKNLEGLVSHRCCMRWDYFGLNCFSSFRGSLRTKSWNCYA